MLSHGLNFFIILFYMCECFVFMSVVSEEGIRSFRNGIMYSFKLLCGCWNLNSHPVEEQSGLLTAETTLNSPHSHFLKFLVNATRLGKHQLNEQRKYSAPAWKLQAVK